MDRDSINLLRPGEPQAGNGDLDERTTVDLDLHTTINALCEHPDQRDTVEQILRALCQDVDTIRYRQEVLADLLAAAELETYSDCVEKLARPSRLAQK